MIIAAFTSRSVSICFLLLLGSLTFSEKLQGNQKSLFLEKEICRKFNNYNVTPLKNIFFNSRNFDRNLPIFGKPDCFQRNWNWIAQQVFCWVNTVLSGALIGLIYWVSTDQHLIIKLWTKLKRKKGRS